MIQSTTDFVCENFVGTVTWGFAYACVTDFSFYGSNSFHVITIHRHQHLSVDVTYLATLSITQTPSSKLTSYESYHVLYSNTSVTNQQ